MKSRLVQFYYRIRYSIGYYPTIIAMAYFVFALAVVTLPNSVLWQPLEPLLEWSELPRVYNDQVVLSALITGIISFITLSFAMVMVVLSNVSTTFSPKLLLGLVTEKTHQVVLGNYIGAILYCLILLLSISSADDFRFRDLSVILAAAMGGWCLVLFIYFIHNISTSVQVGNIVEKIYYQTRRELLKRQQADTTLWQKRPPGRRQAAPVLQNLVVFRPNGGRPQRSSERLRRRRPRRHNKRLVKQLRPEGDPPSYR